MVVTFVGHSELFGEPGIKDRVRSAILEAVPKEEKVSFYCGGYGDFDFVCAKVCFELKKVYPNSELVFVSPYVNPSKNRINPSDCFQYDAVIYPPLEGVPPRYAIVRRNEWMVLQADLIISYVLYPTGGAARTLQFARRRRRSIVELSQPPSS